MEEFLGVLAHRDTAIGRRNTLAIAGSPMARAEKTAGPANKELAFCNQTVTEGGFSTRL